MNAIEQIKQANETRSKALAKLHIELGYSSAQELAESIVVAAAGAMPKPSSKPQRDTVPKCQPAPPKLTEGERQALLTLDCVYHWCAGDLFTAVESLIAARSFGPIVDHPSRASVNGLLDAIQNHNQDLFVHHLSACRLHFGRTGDDVVPSVALEPAGAELTAKQREGLNGLATRWVRSKTQAEFAVNFDALCSYVASLRAEIATLKSATPELRPLRELGDEELLAIAGQHIGSVLIRGESMDDPKMHGWVIAAPQFSPRGFASAVLEAAQKEAS